MFPINTKDGGLYYGKIVEPDSKKDKKLERGKYLVDFLDDNDPTICKVEGGIYFIGEPKNSSIINDYTDTSDNQSNTEDRFDDSSSQDSDVDSILIQN